MDNTEKRYIFEAGAIDTTEKTYMRVPLINGNKLTSKSNLAKVQWIESRCNGYKFIMSPKHDIPYAVFLTEQDYIMFTLKWK